MITIMIDILKRELINYISQETIDTVFNNVQQSMTNTCQFTLLKGKNKGNLCNRKCPGGQFCKKHISNTEEEEKHRCQFIIIRNGEEIQCKRNTQNKYCKTHEKKVEQENLEIIEEKNVINDEVVVDELQETVVDEVVVPQSLNIEDNNSDNEITESKYDDITENKTETLNIIPFIPQKKCNLIKPTPLFDTDNDCEILIDDITEEYEIHRSWGCQYWTKNFGGSFCSEDTVVDDQFCKKHSRHAGKIPFKMRPHDDPVQEVNPVFFRHHQLTGHFWFPQMLLVAKPTSEGMVVIGRLLGQRWLKSLTEREIKRCHNSGLLYKVLPQEILHKNYDIPNIENIDGFGFTSFDQMRFDRPTLYIKYWNIWNKHIQARKEFIKKHDGYKKPNEWMKEHTCELPDWNELKEKYNFRGYKNVIVPPPSLDDLKNVEFDPWEYCENWVKTNQPNLIQEPHFPPMFLDYPNPLQMRFRPFEQTRLKEKEVNKNTPRRTKHYNYNPDWWLERITTGGKEWMEIYF